MRNCNKTRNYAPIESLIEEVQILANRMESALSDKRDIKSMNEEWRELKNKLKELRKEVQSTDGPKDLEVKEE
jgi:ElaB/YqjD/DUF883 family membrane-anchored ribosome-binding protein